MNHALLTSSLWLIPALPLVASAASALLSRSKKKEAATLAITSMTISLLLSLAAFGAALGQWRTGGARLIFNFEWFELAATGVRLGWVLDPLSAQPDAGHGERSWACSFSSIAPSATWRADQNFTRFFCFLSLFAGGHARVGTFANSLLLFFICWELDRTYASYLADWVLVP
jgi:NADH-quinone oxidoreductase subunit L